MLRDGRGGVIRELNRLTSKGCKRVSFPIKSARSGGERSLSRDSEAFPIRTRDAASQDTRPSIRGTSAGVVNDIRFLFLVRDMAPKKLRIISFFRKRLSVLALLENRMLPKLPTSGINELFAYDMDCVIWITRLRK